MIKVIKFVKKEAVLFISLAAALISMLPLLILYAFVQKFFIEGITSGSVKG